MRKQRVLGSVLGLVHRGGQKEAKSNYDRDAILEKDQ